MNCHPNKEYIILLFVGFMLLFSACDGRPRGIISQGKMANVLTEMHKTDALLDERGLTNTSYSTKASYYNFIFKKYDISKAEFDSSLVWYTKNPQIFNNVYDKVVVQLTDLQKDVTKGKYHPIDTIEARKIRYNIWIKRPNYLLTKDSARTHLDFEIPDQSFFYKDVYVLKFLQRISPEDSCKNQLIRFQINYTNGRVQGVIRKVKNDGVTRRYTFRLTANYPKKIKSISGQLLGSSIYKGKLNAKIDSITLTRIFDPIRQPEILKILQKSDKKNYPTFDLPQSNINNHFPPRNKRSLILKK